MENCQVWLVPHSNMVCTRGNKISFKSHSLPETLDWMYCLLQEWYSVVKNHYKNYWLNVMNFGTMILNLIGACQIFRYDFKLILGMLVFGFLCLRVSLISDPHMKTWTYRIVWPWIKYVNSKICTGNGKNMFWYEI